MIFWRANSRMTGIQFPFDSALIVTLTNQGNNESEARQLTNNNNTSNHYLHSEDVGR